MSAAIDLNDTMLLFWQQGYDNTNFNALVASTGCSRKAIYQTWGDKQGLYEQCLINYQNFLETHLLQEVIAAENDGLNSLRDFFLRLQAASQNSQDGCLMIKTINEINQHNDKIKTLTNDFLTLVHFGFRRCLLTAENNNTLKNSCDIEQSTQLLFALNISIGCLNNNTLSQTLCQTLIQQALNYLQEIGV